MLIWHCGRVDFQGSFTFVGILYNANNSDGTCDPSPVHEGRQLLQRQTSVDDRARRASPRTAASASGARWRSTAAGA